MPNGLQAKHCEFLALDFGLARIGVAKGVWPFRMITPLPTIESEVALLRFDLIERLLCEHHIRHCVLGKPLAVNGDETNWTQRVLRFGRQLQGRFKVDVYWVDERYTSVEAESALRASGVRLSQKNKAQVDAWAACLLLEDFFDQYPLSQT